MLSRRRLVQEINVYKGRVVTWVRRQCLSDDKQHEAIATLGIVRDIYLHCELIIGQTEDRALQQHETSVMT